MQTQELQPSVGSSSALRNVESLICTSDAFCEARAPRGEANVYKVPACVHMHVIYIMSVRGAHTSFCVLQQMLVLDVCVREPAQWFL